MLVGHGTLRPPSLVASVEGYGRVPAREAIDLGLQPSHLSTVQRGMAAVAATGTAAAKLDHALLEKLGVDIAGKTGTPQVYRLPDHSWFVGYLPRKNPFLAFAIFLEHTGEHGGDGCVPVFNDLMADEGMQFYLSQELSR